MSHTSRTLRLALLTASSALAAGSVLLPTGAFAAPATPPAITVQADDDSGDEVSDSTNEDELGSLVTPGETDENPSEPTESDSGVVPDSYCNDPMAAPGLCVDGKPLPKGDDSVTVPQAPPNSGVVPDSYCNDPMAAPGLCVNGKPLPKGDGSVIVPQAPYVPSPTGSSTARLAV
ncbi:hypothetical protein [Streptomyces sp. NPDC088762]|uniref:hypothetical protein n=1 Tax=Streptomyces sp. NPDC088762 TaxID=3365891 RepID=UPI003815BE1B